MDQLTIKAQKTYFSRKKLWKIFLKYIFKGLFYTYISKLYLFGKIRASRSRFWPQNWKNISTDLPQVGLNTKNTWFWPKINFKRNQIKFLENKLYIFLCKIWFRKKKTSWYFALKWDPIEILREIRLFSQNGAIFSRWWSKQMWWREPKLKWCIVPFKKQNKTFSHSVWIIST